MEFISHISFDSCKSFIKDHPAFTLLVCAAAGIGLYGSYKYKYFQKIYNVTNSEPGNIIQPAPQEDVRWVETSEPDNIIHPVPQENVRWVKTNDGKLIKLKANFANNILHIDTQIEHEKKIRILELFAQHVLKIKSGQTSQLNLNTQDLPNSENNPYTIPCSQDELRLILEALYAMHCNISFLQFTQDQLNTLSELAITLNIPLISGAISDINLLTVSEETFPGLKDVLRMECMQKFFTLKGFSKTSLFKDIMAVGIQPTVLTKKEFEKTQAKDVMIPRKWYQSTTDKDDGRTEKSQCQLLFYTHDKKYYVTDHLITSPHRMSQFRVYSSTTNTHVGSIESKTDKSYALPFPHSQRLIYSQHTSNHSYHYNQRYFIYDIEQKQQ